MAYQDGFVTGDSTNPATEAFLLVIKNMAELNGWVTERYDTTGAIKELILRGEGLSADKQIYVGFRAYKNIGADVYNLSVAGFTGYVPGNSFITQPGYFESGIPAYFPRIDYWLAINAQRIVFGIKVGTPVYEHGYAGFFFPYARPTQYPYPLVVGGMLNGIPETRFSETTHSLPYKGTRENFKVRWLDGTWVKPDVHPYVAGMLANGLTGFNAGQVRDTDASFSAIPITLLTSAGVLGSLDGVFYIVGGFGNVVESLTTIDAVDHITLQDVVRTGARDYITLRKS